MFGLFKKKQTSTPEASKGYHSCVDSCEKDISNLETECENLRTDNVKLVAKVAQLQEQENKGQAASTSSIKRIGELNKQVESLTKQLEERDERIAELEQRLEEADEKADGTPVKYASARKALTKAKLKSLRQQLEAAPAGANFGGSCSVYDKKTKRVSLVEFKSKKDALDLLDKAEKGNVDIIM